MCDGKDGDHGRGTEVDEPAKGLWGPLRFEILAQDAPILHHGVQRRADKKCQDGGADEPPADGPVPPGGTTQSHVHLR